jgi:hypothetical protein
LSGPGALRLDLHPSSALAAAVGLAHLAAGSCLWLLLPGLAGWVAAALATGLGVATVWDRALLGGRHAARSVELGGEGDASVCLADGTRVPVSAEGCRAGRFWVILELGRRSRRHLLVTGSMLEAHAFRNLRLWVRWGRLPAGVAAPRC